MLGVMLCMGMMMAGCAKTQEAPQAEVNEMSMEEAGQDTDQTDGTEENAGGTEDAGKDADGTEDAGKDADGTEGAEQDAEEREDKKQDVAKTDDTDEGQTVNTTQGVEHLGGKVQSPQEDGMILAQTTIMDENNQVTLLTVEDAKKIPVKFTADTKVEHWTIQGGGAGIDMKEAVFSDLKEGMGVELEGYFEGDVFVATKVIIEVYA